ncbi:2-hexaprenyl-6-methoxy-1,4-benzoquinone methyltransferase [Coemansia spiralis]|uniref:2-hexaprenyl-6-methoxy-1,4-benzoquinone methyltransferase n=1 Tax=Coemansia spiralis TaxID=417178 RepID=A0A9W8GMH6_9FUNG|nr:2-hexaprenyl-6-methoxy-1,4-benzoquinone methyltransferase [Coemansia spiralis]
MFSRNAFTKVIALGLGSRGASRVSGSLRSLMTATSSTRQQLMPALEHPSSARPKDDTLYGDIVPIDAKEEIMDRTYCKVADRYDMVLEAMSLGLNQYWKKKFVRLMSPAAGLKMIDMAGGTGQIARNYLEYQDLVNNDKSSSVHVVDLNEQMLRVGRHRFSSSQWTKDRRISFAQGSAENLVNVADNSFDIYSISAGMHNIPHPELALSEAYRVLKPGGVFACLEYGHVDTPIVKQLHRWHLGTLAPAIGQLLVNKRESYERLVCSALSFPHQRDFAKAIRRAGFRLPPGKGYELMHHGYMVAFFGTKPE